MVGSFYGLHARFQDARNAAISEAIAPDDLALIDRPEDMSLNSLMAGAERRTGTRWPPQVKMPAVWPPTRNG